MYNDLATFRKRVWDDGWRGRWTIDMTERMKMLRAISLLNLLILIEYYTVLLVNE